MDYNIDESYQKLYEDFDKAGVLPHTVMGIKMPGKLATGAAGLAALAGAALGKGVMFLGKHAFMKKGFLKVLKRIGEIEDYVINGNNSELFRRTANLKYGKEITTVKHYDDIKETILNEIKSDIEEFNDFKNGNHSGNSDLNDQGSLVYIVNKYKKFFSNINRNFSQVNSGDSDEDIYNNLQKTIAENINKTEDYVKNVLIESFKKRFTIGKEDNVIQNRRLNGYIKALEQAWNVVKGEIIQKYKKLAVDINRSPEFKKLYDIVDNLYKTLPNTKYAVNNIMDKALNKIGKTLILEYTIDASNNLIIDVTNSNNKNVMDLLHDEGNRPIDKPISLAVNEYNNSYKTDYKASINSNTNKIDAHARPYFGDKNSPTYLGKDNNNNLYIPIQNLPNRTIPIKNGNEYLSIQWSCKFEDYYGNNAGTGTANISTVLLKNITQKP